MQRRGGSDALWLCLSELLPRRACCVAALTVCFCVECAIAMTRCRV